MAQQHLDVRAWLDVLAERVDDICARWELVLTGPAMAGGTSIILPVTSAAGDRALKLVSPAADADREARALQLLEGTATVRLHRHDAAASALLLDLLPGPTLSVHEDAREAVEVCGEIAARIAAVPAGPDVPSMARAAARWSRAFAAQHQRALDADRALPSEAVHAAASTIESLTEERSCGMTHGDLSFANVLRTATGGWIAIDPMLLSGPPEHEAHTVLRSVPRSGTGARDSATPGQEIRDLLVAFCAAGGLDARRAWRISQARFAASAYWEAEHDGDLADVDWLRAMACELDL